MSKTKNTEAILKKAAVLHNAGKHVEALACVEAMMPKMQVSAPLLNIAAASAVALGRYDLAEKYLRTAIQVQPGYAEAHYNLGKLLKEFKRFAEAETAYRQAIALKPMDPDAHYDMGALLKEFKRFAEAEAAYRQAISLNPGYAEAHNNLGNLLLELRRFEEAEAAYRQISAIKYVGVQWNLSLLLLRLGRFEEAWPLYEARYHQENKRRITRLPSLSFPQWQGESLTGKSILICPEQGFGDEIQFVRYAPLLKELGVSKLTLGCKPPLKALMQTAAGVDAVFTGGDFLLSHDFWTFPLSLPLHFHTTLETIPATLPYLKVDPECIEHWRSRLPSSGFRVGLVWKGFGGHKNDANRSLPGLSTLAPLWSVPNVAFVSLQKGQGEEEALQPPEDQPILNLGAEIRDFADTAAIVSKLDLVICVDTAIAHLAGALGKPCWVLLPAVGTDWRWLHERPDSPWYPGVMRLFRQETPDDWPGVMAKAASALADLAGGNGDHLSAGRRQAILLQEAQMNNE